MSTEQTPSKLYVVRGSTNSTPRDADIWLGPEIFAANETEIPARSHGKIVVDLLKLRKEVPQDRIDYLAYSGRSSIAQRGGDLAITDGARSVRAALAIPKTKELAVPIVNYSDRPLTIAQGAIAQTYTKRGTSIKAARLYEMIASEQIRITSKQDKDWWIHTDNRGRAVGIGMALEKPEKRIVPSNEPIPVPVSARNDFRKQLKEYLTPIQKNDAFGIQIGTTVAEIGFDQGILGIIDPTITTAKTPKGMYIVNQDHINSVLLSAHDHWQIRTETLPSEQQKEKREKLDRRGVVFQFLSVASMEETK